ncbi:hypothetical protein L1987_04274 [Smallanthus sonchifolius]|uniref:Uncharacterized protein n=1 Tax=Smallanthus sonchifolius TaxID=185202 RepID=A0ACB9KD63_9ASTR|nr:hypothetical protein L1987_04274 [Smallanthus sonchifolius]
MDSHISNFSIIENDNATIVWARWWTVIGRPLRTPTAISLLRSTVRKPSLDAKSFLQILGLSFVESVMHSIDLKLQR